MDAALTDGDHNWYTVINELRLLREVARAHDAPLPVLILHDPTTAVDAVTEHAIAQGIRALRHPGDLDPRYATLVVTSSPALLSVTDRVLVLDGGRIVTEGTHHELTGSDERYRQAVLR